MSRKMLVDAVHPEETRVVITDNKSSILEFDFTTAAKPQIKGNVYLAKVTRVEPSLQAAFVEYGGGKQGFLPFSEIHPNYYQIPTSDRQKLIEEEEKEAALDAQEDEDDETEELEQDAVTTVLAERAAEDSSVKSEEIEEADEEEKAEKPKRGRRRRTKKDDDADKVDAKEESEDKPSDDKSEEESKDKTSDDAAEESETEGKDADSKEGDDEDDKKSNGRRRRGGRSRNRRGGRSRNSRKDGDESGEVEVLSGEDEIERPRRKREYTRRYKIQEVIKRNQVLLVQVIKEERGNKGVSLTSFLSLAGRYCVLMPNSPRGGGVSRKISSNDDRKRLKKVLNDLALPTGMSVIIRTAGSGHTRTEIKRDFDYLVKLWNQIREDTLSSSAPALVYEESNIVQRCIRDSYNTDIDEILVDGEDTFKETKAFMKRLIPSHAPRVKLHKGDAPLFYKEGIDDQLTSMMEPEVNLPSGGSIVMVPTEALISIDVNSGRSTRERNVEETAVKTNLEAAKEVARQLRLRDLAGLIVIDFIDMMDGKNRRSVERAMKEALRHDKAKIQVGRISTFGLMEMSRQRMRPSISESINRSCPHCQGTGMVRSEAALGIQIIRALEKEASSGEYDRFRVSVTASEALYILNNMRAEIDKIEETYTCSVEILIDGTLHEGDHRIEKLRRKGSQPNRQSSQSRDENTNDDKPRGRRRGGRGRGRNNRTDDSNEAEKTEDSSANDAPKETVEKVETSETVKTTETVEVAEAKDEKPKRKPRRTSFRKKSDDVDEVKSAPKEEESAKPEEQPKEPEAKEEKPKKTRGRPRKKAEDDAPKAEKAEKPKAANDEPAAPAKPKRSGWWQKIVD